jgi:penicillin-binding protein 1A
MSMLKKTLLALSILFVLGAAAGLGGLYWAYNYFSRDLPDFTTIEDYKPDAVTSVYSSDGTLIGEFYKERRYPVSLSEIPEHVRKAFLASEDANFYEHPGIDVVSIVRALIKNIQTGKSLQGGSTITQQVVKNLLLTPEKRIERKVKEAILSYRLEKRLSKDDILEIYLNQIFFGNTAYGIRSAVELYYRKQLHEVTIAEAAMLAGLPKAPSRYSPIYHYDRARRRQLYVIRQMEEEGFISTDQAKQARNEKLVFYPAPQNNIFYAPYYVTEVRNRLLEKWPDLPVDTGGLTIRTAVDLEADKMAQKALRKGLLDVDKRRGWRGPLAHFEESDEDKYRKAYVSRIPEQLEIGEIYPALVLKTEPGDGTVIIKVGQKTALLDLRKTEWAKRRLAADDTVSVNLPADTLRRGDVIEVSLLSDGENNEATLHLSQTPDIEGSLILLDPNTGHVRVVIGGYDYSRSQFNRTTQMRRQPGSAFKPIVYLSAIDGFRYTPSTLVNDTPRMFKVGQTHWSPSNFDHKFMGKIPLFRALELSRNLVSADLVSRIGISPPIEYARKLGIESPLGKNLSLSLGSSEVSILELARAYGVFAAQGALFDSVFITEIADSDGTVLYDYQKDRFNRVVQAIPESSAFIMAHMMKGVVLRGTAQRVSALNRPVAGKTGTTNDQMDAWFVGFTPEWVCVVWAGFDKKKPIGRRETGGKVSAPIFLDFMKEFLEHQDQKILEKIKQERTHQEDRLGVEMPPRDSLAPADFTVPEGVDPFMVDRYSGVLVPEDSKEGYKPVKQYFLSGTRPPEPQAEESSSSYLDSPDL